MKTISIAEFETLTVCNDWKRDQDHEIVEQTNRQVEEWDDNNEYLNLVEIPCVWGWAHKISTLDNIKIIYTESFRYDMCDSESFSTVTSYYGQDKFWSIKGVVVVDEDGEEVTARELSYHLSDDFSDIDYSSLEIGQITDIDVDEDSKMETFILKVDNEPSIRFTGKLIASAYSSDHQNDSYSGRTGRWAELELYKTKSGKFVCNQVGISRWENERDRHSVKVCETLEEVKEFFGHRWLAKRLYAEAKIEDVIEVG